MATGPMRPRALLEVSDLVIAFDPASGHRLPVRRVDAVGALAAVGDRRAARVVGRLPVDGEGVLEEAGVDDLLVRMHVQLQRLWEELHQAELGAGLLRPLLAAARDMGVGSRRMRVVDVGSGLGYFVRWVASTGALGPDVEVVGCDFDPVLVAEARRLAELEGLACRFEVGDAFALHEGADVYISSGLLHHVPADRLAAFFAAQRDAVALVHWDPVPTYLAPLGSWLFHRSRMRDPLARHDGLRSVQRAHADQVLLDAVASGAPELATALYGLPNRWVPVLDVLRPVIAVRADVAAPFRRSLGAAGNRLVPGRGPW